VLVFLNNDTQCLPGFLGAIATTFEDDPGLGSVTPVSLKPDGLTIDSCGVTVDRTLVGCSRLTGRPVSDAAAPRPLLAGPGAGGAEAYRRTAFVQVGGFDPLLPFYGSETDLAIRLAAVRWRAGLAAGAACIHLRSATSVPRYGVMRGRSVLRVLATEAVIVAGDAALSRDFVALGSRIRGWRAAADLPRLEPGAAAIDTSIGFVESLRMRWRAR
jgi:GT2 family glycosyltransferase